eukprot:403353027
MEGIINLEDMFDQDQDDQNCDTVTSYNLGQHTLQMKSRALHIGVSRSVWKASIALAHYLDKNYQKLALQTDQINQQDLKNQSLKILELGSGPGLSGLYSSLFFKNAKIFMTDICPKSLNLIKDNIQLNQELLNRDNLSINYFEWGNFTRNQDFEEFYEDKDIKISKELENIEDQSQSAKVQFPQSCQSQFDLVVASDVVYIPEFLDPLLKSMQYFLKDQSGRCLMVNNKIRQDLFNDRFDRMLEENNLIAEVNEEFQLDSDVFRVFILKKAL